MDCITILCLSSCGPETSLSLCQDITIGPGRFAFRELVSLADVLAEAANTVCGAILVDLDRDQSIDEIRMLREAQPHLPVMALSSDGHPHRWRQAVVSGAHEVLLRETIGPDGFVRALRRASTRCSMETADCEATLCRHPSVDRNRLLDILDALPAYVFLQSPDYGIPFWNRRFAEVFGDPTGRTCYEVFYRRSEPCDPCPTRKVFDTGEPMDSGLTVADGRAYAVCDSLIGDMGNDQVVVEIGIDVTERERLARERNELAAQLRQRHRLESIGRLSSGIAHEINNPLMAMMNYAELIAERVDTEPLGDYARSIQSAGRRVADTIRNLLSFTRVEREPYDTVHLSEPISGAVSLMGEALRRDLIGVDVHVPDDLPPLRCRGRQIEQVLVNLLANARDALNARFPVAAEEKRVLVKAFPLWDPKGGWQRVTVEDYGLGIDAKDLARVRDPFFTTKPCGEGTGLGLSISHEIVTDHGGRMTIESEPGSYTRIHIDLPPEAGFDVQ